MEIVKIPVDKLNEMNSKGFIELTPYIHKNPIVRWLFWKRLRTALNLAEPFKKVLDFGSGSGIFLPTLSRNFKKVYCLDLDIRALKYVKKEFKLKNVKIVKGGKNKLPFPKDYFDAVFATDVLEHFPDSSKVQGEFRRVLKKGGVIIISGPTENVFYQLARKFLYRREKPADHYTDIADVMGKTTKLFTIEKLKIIPSALIPAFKIYSARKE